MPYTSKAQVITRWGTDETVLSADRDPQDGVADDGAIDAACADASSLIDSYLARAGYDTPVNPAPAVLTLKASDIAIYLLSQAAGSLTKEKRLRYEDALEWLSAIADGKAELPDAPDASKAARGGRASGFPLAYQARNLRGSGLL
jgi:phage gp36-like protein